MTTRLLALPLHSPPKPSLTTTATPTATSRLPPSAAHHPNRFSAEPLARCFHSTTSPSAAIAHEAAGRTTTESSQTSRQSLHHRYPWCLIMGMSTWSLRRRRKKLRLYVIHLPLCIATLSLISLSWRLKSYVAASADAAPSYWDNTVHAPSALDLNGDMLIDDLPTGSLVVFVSTTLVSWFFQLPGFILTYLLHGSHAGRLGSQAGLALTLIQFGFGTTVMSAFAPPSPDDAMPSSGEGGSGSEMDGFPHWGTNSTTDGDVQADMRMAYAGHEWISFLLMTIGTHCTFFPFCPSVVTC